MATEGPRREFIGDLIRLGKAPESATFIFNELNASASTSGVQVSGTPLDSQIPVWTDATTVEGTSSLSYDGISLQADGVLSLQETASAPADIAGYGRFWTRNDTPNIPMFTNDVGTDFVLNQGVIPNGTEEGDLTYWDNTGSQWLTSNDFQWLESSTTISLGDHLQITGALGGTIGVTGVTTFLNGNGEDVMRFVDTDGGVVIIDEPSLRLAEGSHLRIYGVGADPRADIYASGTSLIFASEVNIDTFDFQEGVSITTNMAKPVKASSNTFWNIDESGGTSLHVVNGAGFSYPVAQYDTITYRFNSPITAADPGANFMRANNAVMASTTALYFDDIDYDEDDGGWWLNDLAANDLITLRQGIDKDRWAIFKVSSAPTDNTGWWTVPVSFISVGSAGTGLVNGQEVQIYREQHSKITAVGDTSVSFSTGNGTNFASGSSAQYLSGSTQTIESGSIFEIEEAASMTDPAAGVMRLWSRDDAPNILVVTDDAGDDHDLHDSVSVGLTADVSSVQGGGVITTTVNVYSTVATTGDAATLTDSFIVGQKTYIKNDGANSMDVFPASGDDAGAGTDTAIAIAAGVGALFIGTVANATWTQIY